MKETQNQSESEKRELEFLLGLEGYDAMLANYDPTVRFAWKGISNFDRYTNIIIKIALRSITVFYNLIRYHQ